MRKTKHGKLTFTILGVISSCKQRGGGGGRLWWMLFICPVLRIIVLFWREGLANCLQKATEGGLVGGEGYGVDLGIDWTVLLLGDRIGPRLWLITPLLQTTVLPIAIHIEDLFSIHFEVLF